nr:MAG TPA: hypothetical protein [Caudoviricetes sp.]
MKENLLLTQVLVLVLKFNYKNHCRLRSTSKRRS